MDDLLVIKQDWKHFTIYLIIEKSAKGSVRVFEEDGYICISDLYVTEEYRGNGIGTSLLRKAIEVSKTISEHGEIEVLVNERSDAFVGEWYERNGFKLQKEDNEIILNEYGEVSKYVLKF